MGTWDEVDRLAGRLSELSYFELLGVDRDVDALKLREAYYALLRRYHPDRALAAGGGAARQRQLARICARVGEAYRCLSHPKQRAAYLIELAGGDTRLRAVRRTSLSDQRDPRGEKARSLLDGARALLSRGNRAGARAKLELALQFEPQSRALRRELDRLTRTGKEAG